MTSSKTNKLGFILELGGFGLIVELYEIGGDMFNHVTISGGNPALIKGIQELVDLFETKNIYSALETQGSKFQPWMTQIDDLTISPKPPSSKMKPNLLVLDI